MLASKLSEDFAEILFICSCSAYIFKAKDTQKLESITFYKPTVSTYIIIWNDKVSLFELSYLILFSKILQVPFCPRSFFYSS